ncbi:MAG: TonB-dependent receptor [Acidobacteria bacterium]|nr:TonB-dependent receptor [Acidobacteriota bacterium]
MRRAGLAGMLAFAAGLSLHAQTGTISGLVTDSSGAAAPGAGVTATLVQRNVSRTAATNEAGAYIFNALPPGEYRVEAEKTGFRKSIRPDLYLSINQNLRVDVALEIGELSQTVEVRAAAPLVDTRSPALSSLVDDRRVQDLPINGRNVIGLAMTLPGVLSVSAPQQLTDARSGPIMNVNGGLDTQNLFTFNGGIFINPSRNTGMNYPPPDALREFSVQTASFSAEYGRNAGSQVNVVSKSGSNQLHGSAWEFLRNDNFNARNFFAARRPSQAQNQFGFAAGGPIRKDKLFLFGSYQGLRVRREAVSSTVTVPSEVERGGDFRSFNRTLSNPVDTLTGKPFTDSSGRPCVAGNVVAPGCISPVAKALLPFIPVSGSGRVTILDPQPQNGDMFIVRGDWNQSAKNIVSAHTFIDRNRLTRPQLAGGNIPGYVDRFTNQQTTMATLSDSYTFGPTLLNLASLTFLRTNSISNTSKTVTHDKIGIQNLPFYPESGRLNATIGNISFSGGSGRVLFVSNNWQFRDTLNWIQGRHNFKLGGEWMHLTFLQIFLGNTSMQFNGSRTGHEVADFLIGAYRQVSGGFGVRTNDDMQNAPSLFFQDEFKVHPRLTLTYGLRWEPTFAWVDKYDRLTSLAAIGTTVRSKRFPDAPPGILFGGDPGVPRGITGPDRNNIAPRFGFAWDVFGTGRTSVRGSMGIFYDSIKADAISQEGAPWAGTFQVFDGRAEDPFGSVGATPPPLAPAGDGFGCVNVSTFPGVRCARFPVPFSGLFVDSNLKTPYIPSWNLALERQLTSDIMVRGTYIGKMGIKLDGWRNFNPARYGNDPITGARPSLQNVNNRVIMAPGILAPNVMWLETSFRSWYHSFQGEVIKRFSRGLSFSAAYTRAKSLDLMSTAVFGRRLDNPFSYGDNKGRSDFDRKHAAVASWLWSPAPAFRRPWRKMVLGDWTLTGIHTLQSGAPLSFRMGDDVAQDGSGSRQRAMFKPGAGPLKRDFTSRADMIARYFNTDVFVPTGEVPRGVYGNSGRNILGRPALLNTDFSAMKDFRVSERYRVQFRSEFFNLFNQVVLGSSETTGGANDPDNTVNSRTFGQIRGARAAREIQFALKFIW